MGSQKMRSELVHVMLKPDTLESGLRDDILKELLKIGGTLLLSKRLILNQSQIAEIYPDFPNERARPTVFKYFTTKETEHLAFLGEPGIHKKYKEAKGKTGASGIRGRYYTRYTRLSPEELSRWLEGSLENIAAIDLEMFGRDILHVPDSPAGSKRGLRSVLDCDTLQIDQFRRISLL
jgi:nucleoside diphosphate kinase